jgi:(1->4)-alpha-D-glucan 1-alpha-D-glucosylmutase
MTPGSPAPSSTYRLQISEHFTLHHAVSIVEYVARLGVGALYLSPLLRSSRGSTHGYDVVDHTLVDPQRGGEDGLRALADAARGAGIHLVVDIVPNHMGVADATQNRAWWELLRGGEEGEFASWFDVDWEVADGRVLIPVLADDVDPARDLSIVDGVLRYRDHSYPIAGGTRQEGDSAAAVHLRQHYRLMGSRLADTDLNYRRFFSISDLAGVRVEDPEVYEATHREILRWVADYGVCGLRIDHPDGLSAPREYLDRLAASAPGVWIVVEKITQFDEELPTSWPVAGTTGYDALAQVNALLVDPGAEPALDGVYVEVTGDTRSWWDHVGAGKRHVATTLLQAEFRRLARVAAGIEEAEQALTELAVAFPVYRSYLPEGADHLNRAVAAAVVAAPHLAPSIAALVGRLSDPADELCRRFQQVTSAVMAKGVEDTAFYRYSRFIGLNEVGGCPGQFGLRIADFHSVQRRRAQAAPCGMTALSTHDTKRGEDLRARLAVLAELPEEWADVVRQLHHLAPMPDAALAYLIWQSLAATGLIERERVHAYAEKAMREASEGTSWDDPNGPFEQAVHAAVDAAYDTPGVRVLIESFSQRLVPYGWSNSLFQKVVQLTMPGVPDVYQGSESFEGSLVDPDNRRPVDYARQSAALGALERAGSGPPAAGSPSAKQWITRQALHARRDRPDLFTVYRPLILEGPLREHLVAFDRGGAVTMAVRLPVGLQRAGGWGSTTVELPGGTYTDAFTATRYRDAVGLARLFDHYPVALLLADTPPEG